MLFYVALLIFFLSLVILAFTYHINKSARYLFLFLSIIALFGLSVYYILYSKSVNTIAILFGHTTPLFFLAGPFFLFYVKSNLEKKLFQIQLKDWIHFVPSIISLISLLPYYWTSFETKQEIARLIVGKNATFENIELSWLYPNKFNMYARAILLTIYVVICLIKVTNQRILVWDKTSNNYIKQKQLIIAPLCGLTLAIAFASISYLLFLFRAPSLMMEGRVVLMTEYAYMSLIGYASIPVILLLYPEILYGMTRSRMPILKNLTNLYPIKLFSKKEAPLAALHNTAASETALSILQFLEEKKPFLDPAFNIDGLAKSMGLPKQDLQNYFKQEIKQTFIETRKKLRVEYAKQLLLSADFAVLSMEGIWTKAGFSSKTIFFTSFKEITGVTPIEFVRLNKNTPKT